MTGIQNHVLREVQTWDFTKNLFWRFCENLPQSSSPLLLMSASFHFGHRDILSALYYNQSNLPLAFLAEAVVWLAEFYQIHNISH